MCSAPVRCSPVRHRRGAGKLQRYFTQSLDATRHSGVAADADAARAGSRQDDVTGIQRETELRDAVREPRNAVGRMAKDRAGVAGLAHDPVQLELGLQVVELEGTWVCLERAEHNARARAVVGD